VNLGLIHMGRLRRQREGRRPQEPVYPPNLAGEELPPSFAFHGRQEQQQRANFFEPPWYDIDALYELPTAHGFLAESLDASNPPDSNKYAEGNKIRPWAHVRVPTYLAISEWEGGANDEFLHGKIAAANPGGHIVQQIGGQNTIDVSPLVPEAEWTTYGALNALPSSADMGPVEDGYLYA